MCLFSFGLYFWVLIPNLYLVQNKCCFNLFVYFRPIFLILFINLAWNFSWFIHEFSEQNTTFKNIRNWINRPCFIHQFSSFTLKLCFIICSKDVSLTRSPKDEVEKYIFHLWSPKRLKCEYSMNICEPSLYPHNLKLVSILIKPFVTSFIEDLVFVHDVKHKETHASQFHNTFFW